MGQLRNLSCLDVQGWRAFTKREMHDYLEGVLARSRARRTGAPSRLQSLLVVRNQLSPVDMFCYLKARFGEPNGFQNFLRDDSSDNWIHWDFNLKAGGEVIWVAGTYREVHLGLSEKLEDDDWPFLIREIKSDFRRVSKEKSDVLQSLEKWAIFPNKFVQVANVCAELHGDIVGSIKSFVKFPRSSAQADNKKLAKNFKKVAHQTDRLFKNCLELSLLTPVVAEAFINMTILILCKRGIRENGRQFEAFIRSQIDAKIFDLPYKCIGFENKIDPTSETFKKFKRIMDRRNHVIHGNIDPEREQTEIVYFEGKRPLFKEPGDHIAKYFDTMMRLYEPEKIVQDYENTYEFLVSIANCLQPRHRSGFWRVMEDPYPGYDLSRKITGGLLPGHVSVGITEKMRYDDELLVNWAPSASF